MKIHEYQAKELFARAGIPVPPGTVARTPAEAEKAAAAIGKPVVVKAQVLVGGRGKAGGVKLAATPAEAREKAEKILGMDIKGETVQKVLVTEAVDIDREIYVGVIMDRRTHRPLIMASAEGGVEIEVTAREKPEAIQRVTVDPLYGLHPFAARRLAAALVVDADLTRPAADIIEKLYRVYDESDASLAEINPLVVTKDRRVLAIDAKMNFDDNALYRHTDIEAMRDAEAEDEGEARARAEGLSFVRLSGNVGCIVNGAGLAMATMDLVKEFGGQPANFLDIGGSSRPEKVVTALSIILADKSVRSILFNIFGGITRCDDVARGLVTAFDKMKLDLPVVVRLTGTNEAEAREILRKVPSLHTAETMDEAVKKAIALAA
ncbi:MAG: ADP-forming succinate--CoA ligase subunit beta [Candidatus Krumholzibacteria bacterium]|nr:ADP-forming succinate--CoA ligase subunit beta [Candidatus Krumholzibacteria bacterium]MDH4338288.1 ADP-forming succinate--CoA ligase subunit beta [Candidatus Krumholzibacteria bacterium]MDH5268921.1 ADP-forming succinate--CoA ligase subunit beta [Candidatus Krumholzibacteria bacterium]